MIILIINVFVEVLGIVRRRRRRRIIPWTGILVCLFGIGLSGCNNDSANSNLPKAGGKGKDSADKPLVIACSELSDSLNPFSDLTPSDKIALDLTFSSLISFDRKGEPIKWGLDGEKKNYNGKEYTYKSVADLSFRYDEAKDRTIYTFTLGKDVKFSDGEKVNSDDLIFSMYAYLDESYKGDVKIKDADILGYTSYISGNSDYIAGIKRVSNNVVEVTTGGYDIETIHEMDIPICPLHYYGQKDKYHYSDREFGFNKGDISSLIKDKDFAIGTGAYKLVSISRDSAFFDANEDYYKGCPKTAFITLKNRGGSDENKLYSELCEGVYDMAVFDNSQLVYSFAVLSNDNGTTSGNDFTAQFIDGEEYQCICINANNICVNKRPDTTKSKALRKAFATLFACNRSAAIQKKFGFSTKVINYPFMASSWAVPDTEDEDYREAYAYDNENDEMFDKNMDPETRYEKALEVAKDYFKEAGYIESEGILKPNDDLKDMEYEIYLPLEHDDGAVVYTYLSEIVKYLDGIGIDLKIKYVKDSKIEKKLKKNKLSMWCQNFKADPNADLKGLYYGDYKLDNNIFGIMDGNLDENIDNISVTDSYSKKAKLYKKCFNKIFEWGVVVPMYQFTKGVVFRSDNVNTKTISADLTGNYSWLDEIEKVEVI